MKHLKRLKRFVGRLMKKPYVASGLTALAALVILCILARPQITVAKAPRVTYMGCLPTASRLVTSKSGGHATFWVTTETDDTLIIDDFKYKHKVKAHQPELISYTTDGKPGWYSFRLSKCELKGYFVILHPDGRQPRFKTHDHDSTKKQTQKPKHDMSDTHKSNHH